MAGRLVHVEFPVQDPDKATQFYGGVFGWDLQDAGMPDFDYRMFQTGENDGVAVYKSTGGERGPIIYFDTDDIDGTIAKVREQGGEAEDKQAIPSVGWFARCKDPEGTEFSLFQGDATAAPPH